MLRLQEQGQEGVDAQRASVLEYVRRHALPDPIWYVEVEKPGKAAKDVEPRVATRRLLREVTAQDLVLVASRDNWSQDTHWYVECIGKVLDADAGFYAIAEQLDPETPEGKVVVREMARAADDEARRHRQRTVGARAKLRAKGFYVEGRPPYGYKIDPKEPRLIPDPERAPIVRRMFQLAAEGNSSREIEATLAAESGSGKVLDFAAIVRKLHDRTYCGDMRPSAKSDMWLVGTHEALVDRAVFDAVQASFAGRKRRGGVRPSTDSMTADFLLRSLMQCGNRLRSGERCSRVIACNFPTNATKGGGYYLCRGRSEKASKDDSAKLCPEGVLAHRGEVDEQVLADMSARLAALSQELERFVEPKGAPIDFDKRREAVLERQRGINRAYEMKIISLDRFDERMRDCEEEMRALEAEEKAAEAVPKPATAKQILMAMAHALTKKGTLEQRRFVIETLAEKILLIHDRTQARGWRLEYEWNTLPAIARAEPPKR